jgi:hypothetical protein
MRDDEFLFAKMERESCLINGSGLLELAFGCSAKSFIPFPRERLLFKPHFCFSLMFRLLAHTFCHTNFNFLTLRKTGNDGIDS